MRTIDDAFIKSNRPLFRHKKCVFIVGAGISVASGIPDFRSPGGIFSSLRKQLRIDGKQLFTHSFGVKEETRGVYLRCISDLKRLCASSAPNDVHRFLAGYPRSRTYTQNIDGLEERAGMPFTKKDDTRGVYLHGSLAFLSCRYCGHRQGFAQDETQAFSEGRDVQCTLCLERREACLKNSTRRRPVGQMHPAIVHYQQPHPDGAFIARMVERDRDCDLLVVIGTSLKVEGVKKMVRMFSRCESVGGKRVLVNLTRPSREWEDVFDYFYEGDCSDFVAVVEQPAPCAATRRDVPVEISLRRISISREDEPDAQKGCERDADACLAAERRDGLPSERDACLPPEGDACLPPEGDDAFDKLERLSDVLDDAETALKKETARHGTPLTGEQALEGISEVPKGRYKRKAARR